MKIVFVNILGKAEQIIIDVCRQLMRKMETIFNIAAVRLRLKLKWHKNKSSYFDDDFFFPFQDHVPQLNRCPAFTYFIHFHAIMTMIALKAA